MLHHAPFRYQEELAIVEAELAVLERQIAQQRNAGGGMYGGGLYGGGGGGMGVSAVPPEELERLKKQRTALQVWGPGDPMPSSIVSPFGASCSISLMPQHLHTSLHVLYLLLYVGPLSQAAGGV